MSKLGFIQQNSWESEDAEKKYLFESIKNMKKQAWESALKREYDNMKGSENSSSS